MLWSLVGIKAGRSRNGYRLPDPLRFLLTLENGKIGDESWEWAYGCGPDTTYFSVLSQTIQPSCNFDDGINSAYNWQNAPLNTPSAFSRSGRFRVIKNLRISK